MLILGFSFSSKSLAWDLLGLGKELGICSSCSDQSKARFCSNPPDPVESLSSRLVAIIVLEGHNIHTGGSKLPIPVDENVVPDCFSKVCPCSPQQLSPVPSLKAKQCKGWALVQHLQPFVWRIPPENLGLHCKSMHIMSGAVTYPLEPKTNVILAIKTFLITGIIKEFFMFFFHTSNNGISWVDLR